MPNAMKFLKELLANKQKLDEAPHVELNAEMSLKEAHESFSSNSRGPTHEERRLQIDELDEWRTHKLRTHDKPKLCQNELDTFPNQLKVGDIVLLDAADPHIVTSKPDEEIPLTVLSIFPFGFSTKIRPSTGAYLGPCENRAKDFPNTGDDKMPRPCGMAMFEPTKTTWGYHIIFTRKENHRICFQEIEGSVIFRGSNRKNSSPSPTVPPWAPGRTFPNTSGPTFNCSVALGLYTKEFKEENELQALTRHIHFSPSKCLHTLAPGTAFYNPGHFKASLFPPSLRYLHAILAHTITGRQESTGVVNTHDAYFVWCMSYGHVINLAYFIGLAIQHQTERHRKGVISIGPYMTRLARHFGLVSTAAQESSLNLIGQMSPQGISRMLSMRMIERCRGTYPP
ncbi:hypothetical protein GOBAR_AA35600 [Gossypium barbadense]|uniref:Uncharacterized protein n=1 Tax=Gossypium barbadense TaxID=3634 RepID=A0A2P5W1Z8_GOSBA|nr:hypothetical protein GOBAR_AA35600 [Gossypium barbadense]